MPVARNCGGSLHHRYAGWLARCLKPARYSASCWGQCAMFVALSHRAGVATGQRGVHCLP